MKDSMHDSTKAILELFDSSHLPEPLREVAKPFEALAHLTARRQTGKRGAEQTTCLRKLLEAKDCAVRMEIPRAAADDE